MENFKLKIILSLLAGVVFSFFFIILAFVLPAKEYKVYKKSNENLLEKISGTIRK